MSCWIFSSFTVTCASTHDHMWWTKVRRDLDRARAIAERQRAAEEFRPVDEILAKVMTPEQRKEAFELWKAALFDQRQKGTA